MPWAFPALIYQQVPPILLQFGFGLALSLPASAIRFDSAAGRGTTHRGVLNG